MKVTAFTIRVEETIPGPLYGGDKFENIRPALEMSFSVMEGEDYNLAIAEAKKLTGGHYRQLKLDMLAGLKGVQQQTGTGYNTPGAYQAQAAQQTVQSGNGGVWPAQQPKAPAQVGIPKIDETTW